jgi:hypothetical protein
MDSRVTYRSFQDVFSIWRSATRLAIAVEVSPETVWKWKQRDSIPAEYWLRLKRAAREQGVALSCDDLAKIVEK